MEVVDSIFPQAPTVQPSPFIKWAGGKRQLLPEIQKRKPKEFGHYFEPFVGGGSVIFSLRPTNATINDINPQLINTYLQIKDSPEALINEVGILEQDPCDRDFYLSMRRAYNDKIINNVNDASTSALMIWLNKHCFNGLYRVNSKGLFNVPYNNATGIKSVDVDNIYSISNYLKNNNVNIVQGDFATICEDAKVGDFVYFDSPYLPESASANFVDYAKTGFSEKDHKRLAELFRVLDKRGVKLMLSNNNVPLAHELYEGFKIDEIGARRNINRNGASRQGKEVIITNYDY